MLVAITVLHIIITLALIGLVLLQDPKGGAMGGLMGGGGSQSVFGATGAGNFLTTATKWVAIAFGITCIVLTYFTSHRERSVTDDLLPAAAPVTGPASPATAGTPATTDTPTPAGVQDPAAGSARGNDEPALNMNATRNATAPGAGPGAGAAAPAPEKTPDSK